MGSSKSELDAINTDVYRALVLNFDALPIDGNAEEVLLAGQSGPDERRPGQREAGLPGRGR